VTETGARKNANPPIYAPDQFLSCDRNENNPHPLIRANNKKSQYRVNTPPSTHTNQAPHNERLLLSIFWLRPNAIKSAKAKQSQRNPQGKARRQGKGVSWVIKVIVLQRGRVGLLGLLGLLGLVGSG